MTAKKKKPDPSAGLLAGLDAGLKHAEADKLAALDADRSASVALVRCSDIRPRASDTRRAGAAHVVPLAASVAALGLLEPLVVDRNRRLVAGLHRWTVCALLTAEPEGREAMAEDLGLKLSAADLLALGALPAPGDLPEPLRASLVPVRVLVDLDAEADPSAALAAEVAENTARRNYTGSEVRDLVDRLRAAGYRETSGRPRAGEKALRPALETVLGCSTATARRILGTKKKDGQMTTFSSASASLLKACKKWMDAAPGAGKGSDPETINRAKVHAQKLADLLRDITLTEG